MMVQIDAKLLLGWVVFLIIYMRVWNAGVTNMMRQSSFITKRVSPSTPMERAYLFVLGAYTACRTTLLVALYLLLIFCVMSCVQCVLPFLAHMKSFHAVMGWVFSEDVLFSPMRPKLLPFHAAVLVSSLVIAAVFSVVYTSDADLMDPDRCTSIVVREALCMPLLGLSAYIGITLFQATITPP